MRKIALTVLALTQVALILQTHADKKRPLHSTLYSSEQVLITSSGVFSFDINRTTPAEFEPQIPRVP